MKGKIIRILGAVALVGGTLSLQACFEGSRGYGPYGYGGSGYGYSSNYYSEPAPVVVYDRYPAPRYNDRDDYKTYRDNDWRAGEHREVNQERKEVRHEDKDARTAQHRDRDDNPKTAKHDFN